MAPQRVGDMTLEELKEFVTELAEDVVTRRMGSPHPGDRVYDESEDPMLEGLFSGPVDMAERAEDILDQMAKSRGPESEK